MPIPRIQVLGDFRLTYGDEPLMAIVPVRQQALLAYLVLRRDALQSRCRLAFLLGRTPAKLRPSLPGGIDDRTRTT